MKITIMLLIVSSVVLANNNDPYLDKLLKKRTLSEEQRNDEHFRNEWKKFSMYLLKESRNLVSRALIDVNSKNLDEAETATFFWGGELFKSNIRKVNRGIMEKNKKGRNLATEAALDEAIEFWSKHLVFNPKFWMKECEQFEKQKEEKESYHLCSSMNPKVWDMKPIYNF